jgi:hypothetical protein
MAALATQIALSLVPMPAAGSAAAASRSLATVAALWGLSSLCLPGGAPGKPDPHSSPFAPHGCPICQVVHQAATVVPPTQIVLALPAPTAAPLLWRRADLRPPRQPFSTPQSRAPPLLA